MSNKKKQDKCIDCEKPIRETHGGQILGDFEYCSMCSCDCKPDLKEKEV